MNILLIMGLTLFVFAIVWIYVLFMTSSIHPQAERTEKIEDEPEQMDVLTRCKKLYEQGLFSELQRYAQRELKKNYGDTELRKILAQALMALGNDQMAIAHYEAILSIVHYDPEIMNLLADYYCNHGPKMRAIELQEQLLMYDAGNVLAAENLARLYDEVQNYEKSAEMYSLLLDAEFDENKIVELEYALADLYTKLEDNQKAFEVYQKIYEKDPENLEILVLLADLAFKNQFWQECLGFYQKIIETVGDDFEILEKIAQLQVILERWPEAIVSYKKIISLEDKDSVNYLYHQNELCNAMLKNGQHEEAIDILKDLLAHYPKETSFAFTLAQAYTLMGQFEVGVNLYNRLLDKLSSEQSETIIKYISSLICSWAQDLFKKGDYNKAFDKFFEALKYNEENDDVYFQLGKCNYYIKSFQDAIAYFKRAIAIKPTETNYYFGLGCVYDAIGQNKNAQVAFFDALNIDPMNIQARIAYAISLTKELEYARSIEHFSEVLKYIPNDADTIYNLALAYEMAGDIERAIKFYKKALGEEKNHKEARHNLELLLGEPYVDENNINYIEEVSEPEQPLSVFEQTNLNSDENVENEEPPEEFEQNISLSFEQNVKQIAQDVVEDAVDSILQKFEEEFPQE